MTNPTEPWPRDGGEQWRDETEATPDLARRLAVPEGSMLGVETTEYLDPDTRPSHLRIAYIPPDDRGPTMSYTSETWTRAAVAGEAGILGVAVGSGLLIVSLDHVGADGRPVRAEDLVLPGDRWRVRNA